MQPILSSVRRFQLWFHTVSHAQLLLRANPDEREPDRIEVLFVAVDWLSIPTLMNGLTLAEGAPGDLPAGVRTRSPVKPHDGRIYTLTGADYRGFVIAGNVAVSTDQKAYWEPSGFPDTSFLPGMQP